MKFINRIKILKNSTNKLSSIIRSTPLSLIIGTVVILNPLIAVGAIEYFTIKTNNQNFAQTTDSSSSTKDNNLNRYSSSPTKYRTYLSIAIILGILTCIWIALLIIKLTPAMMPMASAIALPPENEATKALPPSSQKYLPASKIESTNDTELITDNKPAKVKANNYAYTLLADMSHELRSPLNAILGFVQIMQGEISDEQLGQENIAIINRSGERLLSIINDVIDLAKIETNRLNLKRNSVDFYNWLENIEQIIKHQALSQGWELSLVKEPNIPQYICIDECRLRQILVNLIDYCQKSISTEKVSLKVSCCNLSTTAEQSESSSKYSIHFAIENPNLTVGSQELATLFDPIVQVRKESKSTEGSSLTLPISRQLARLMGGDITVNNNGRSDGISFHVKIQTESIITEKLPVQSTEHIIGLESNQTEYRILIVDDSKVNRKIMTDLLEPVGFKVKEAVNGQEAVDIWLRWQPHMIWMDLRMPVMNGYEATAKIRSYPHLYTPIIALSASSDEEEKLQFKAAGCDDYMVKPCSKNIILDKIAEHLGIQYVYKSVVSPNQSNFKLTANALNVLPNQLLNPIKQAAIELDEDLLTQLLEEIPPEHNDLKNALQKQVNNFDFDRILNLVEKSKNSKNN